MKKRSKNNTLGYTAARA